MRNKVKNRILNLISLIACLLFGVTSCVSFNEAFVSPGRVAPDSIKAHNIFYTAVSNEVSIQPRDTYEVIGHGAGSWRYYPMDVNRKGFVYGNGYENKKDTAINIIELIDRSIGIDPKMSIEIDAHYAPKSSCIRKKYTTDGAYIIHNIPKWEKKRLEETTALAYLHQNTVRNAMDHFVMMGYYQKSKIYVEIKVDKDCNDRSRQKSTCESDSKALAGELQKYALEYARANNENWLCVTSFSPLALETFREALPDNLKDRFDYVLILGYKGWAKAVVAQFKGYVPSFSASVSSFVETTEWLDCVWFSVQGIKNYKEEFTEMMERRGSAHPALKDVEFSFATYPFGKSKMKCLMTKGGKSDIKIRSFMLDVDDPKKFKKD